MSNAYCLYLRKSRADLDSEKNGEEETLARHERILLDVAKKQKIVISKIYREVVSGETIAARPIMQELLQSVEDGTWNGVLVVEVERLARGDTMDQGLVAQTFKYSNTKIITPSKTYDPNNEFDEEYFEFGLFMSRREYKTINRRLQRGRLASCKEGKYVSSVTPFGYTKEKAHDGKGFILVPDTKEAYIIKLIFDLYVNGQKQGDGSTRNLGISLIARHLNELGFRTRKNGLFSSPTIRDILINPVYIGKIKWEFRKGIKSMRDGNISISRPRNANFTLVDGLHTPIIQEDTFYIAKDKLSKHRPSSNVFKKQLQNQLSGLVYCQKCNRIMQRKLYTTKTGKKSLLSCLNPNCNNVANDLDMVETRILESVSNWLSEYEFDIRSKCVDSNSKSIREQLKIIENEIADIDKQMEKLYDLLEQSIYDTETFLKRSDKLRVRLTTLESAKEEVKNKLMQENARTNAFEAIIPKAKNLLETYYTVQTAQDKNNLLKTVLNKVVYLKDTKYAGKNDMFKITIFPSVPEK